MTRNYRIAIWSAAAAVMAVALSTTSKAQKMDESTARSLVRERVATYRGGGMVVAVLDSAGAYIIGEGKVRDDDTAAPDGNTIFEIGSITKVFTALLLADMAEHGELKLDDPIAKLLPRSVKPSATVRKITLLDLATHRSGLPRLPNDFTPADMSNPYASYTSADLYRFISRYKLPRAVGSAYEYSNLGMGLLGHLLALKEGMTYDSLVHSRITGPLGMESTMITVPPSLAGRFAQGHEARGVGVPHWDVPTISGAGALRSTASDMLLFLRAAMGLAPSSLEGAFTLSEQARADVAEGLRIGLGWHVLSGKMGELVWHNGGTGGFRSFIGFDRARKVGIVILSNNTVDCDDLAVRILRGSQP